MQFSTGSFIFLFILILVIIAIVAFTRWRNGQSVGLDMPNRKSRKKQATPDDTTPCFNIYLNKMVVENVKVDDVLVTWDIRGKPYVFQSCIDDVYTPIMLPDDITYQPDRLARMIGCIPLKRLKSLKFSLLDRLAPFAPVVALIIAAILLLIVMD